METQTNIPSPENIMKIGTGFWASKVLLSAVNFELFTKLAEKKSMTAQQVKQELDLKSTDRNVFDFLDTLTGLGFLTRQGLLETAMYSNAADTDLFLDKKKQTYIGGMLEMMNNRLFRFWGSLEEALTTGQAQNETKEGIDLFEMLYCTPEKLEEFINAMCGIQMGNFMMFAQKFDFSKYKTLTDAGGSNGLLSLMVAKHNAHMHCVSFDLPPVAPIAEKTIQHFQLSKQVKSLSGNFLTAEIPAADIIVMGNILHDWDEETKIKLMQKAYASLPKGGAFVAIESIIDNDRKQNVFGLMMSLNMLIESGKGFDYTFADFTQWAKICGFSSTTLLPLAGPSSAAIAIK
jgi:hypothetical protein